MSPLQEGVCVRLLRVDYNPDLVRSEPMGQPVLFGDAEDPEFIATLPLARTRWVAHSIKDGLKGGGRLDQSRMK